jgi:hypothetical protein
LGQVDSGEVVAVVDRGLDAIRLLRGPHSPELLRLGAIAAEIRSGAVNDTLLAGAQREIETALAVSADDAPLPRALRRPVARFKRRRLALLLVVALLTIFGVLIGSAHHGGQGIAKTGAGGREPVLRTIPEPILGSGSGVTLPSPPPSPGSLAETAQTAGGSPNAVKVTVLLLGILALVLCGVLIIVRRTRTRPPQSRKRSPSDNAGVNVDPRDPRIILEDVRNQLTDIRTQGAL